MAGIAHVITPDSASGAQVIDGSLRFNDDNEQFLKKTPSYRGNRRTFTFSCWTKRSELAAYPVLFSAGSASGDVGYLQLSFEINPLSVYIRHNTGGNPGTWVIPTSAFFRDTSWYHIVMAVDTTAAASDRVKLYVNGAEQLISNLPTITENFEFLVNNNGILHQVGAGRNQAGATSVWYDGHLSNVYFIDGQALGPEYFGFTDPLTNTWKPKKVEFPKRTFTNPKWYSSATLYTSVADVVANATDRGNGGVTVSNEYCYLVFNDGGYANSGGGANSPDYPVWTDTASFDDGSGGTTTRVFYYDTSEGDNWFNAASYNSSAGEWNQWRYSTSSSYSPYTIGKDLGIDGGNMFVFCANASTANPTSAGKLSSATLPTFDTGSFHVQNLVRDTFNTGGNSFYLPFDGNSPIVEDKFNNGNNWTPVNFGGSVELDKSTGAKPILNTTPGGTHAGVGVFGSKQNVGYAVTVYNDGGGNKYYIDGVKQDTVTGLIRGATYTFDTSDSTVSSHPFRFSATSNGSHGGGSEYTNGVAAITGAATTITVPHDAPNTLYYYCTSHSGMGADITGITTNEKLADQYASNIVFASPLVGVNNDVCASIACTMTNKSVTSNGDAAAANEQSNFYAGSFEFDGTGDYLSSSSSDLSFGTGDFTVECWVYQTSNADSNDGIFQISTNSGGLNPSNSNSITLQAHDDSKYRIYANDTATPMSTSVITDKWVHLAVVRDSGTTKLFVNGIQDATTISDSRNYSGTYLAIGGYFSTSYLWVGYIQDFRVYKGVAKYTSDFVVPSTNPDILPDTPSGVAGGSKLTRITEGAVSFDGSSGTSLTVSSAGSMIRTNDFTVEFFIYSDSTVDSRVFSLGQNNNTGSLVIIKDSDGIRVNWESNGASGGDLNVVKSGWHHVAAVRSSNNLKVYIDGKLDKDYGTVSVDFDASTLYIGDDSTVGSSELTGIISNLRVVQSALYTSNFTPPSAPLTNVTNTKLLCCQSNTSATEAAVFPGTGQQYTLQVSGSDYNATYSKDKMFDSSEVSAYLAGDSSNVNWTIPGGLAFSSKLRVRAQGSGSTGTITFNWDGGSYDLTVLNAGAQYYDVTSNVTSPITSITWTTGASAVGPYVSAWEVDDSLLVDRGPIAVGNVTATNFNPFNTDINTVRGQETGYATWNPLTNRGIVTTSDGNLTANAINSGYGYTLSTIPVSSGKYYCEISFEGTMSHNTNYNYIGIVPTDSAANYTGQDIFRADGALSIDSNSSVIRGTIGTGSGDTNNTYQSSYGFDENDTIGIAIDCDTPQVTFYKNGTSIGTFPHTMQSNKSWVLFVNDWANAADFTGYILNAGQRTFKFPPPDGFQPMNAANTRPETVIARPDQYVGITTYIGNGGTKSISDLKFNAKPDLVWIKNRDSTENHMLFDTVRGAYQYLYPNAVNKSNDGTSYDRTLTKFDFNGFTLKDDSGGGGWLVNKDGDDYVSWCWKAGGNLDPDLRCTTRMTGNVYSGEGSYDNLFDGSVNTYALPDPSLTWSPTNWTEANSVTSFRIHATRYANGGSGGTLTVVHSGGTVNITVNTNLRVWHDVYSSGTNYITDIQSVTWTKEGSAGSSYNTNSYVLVFAFEINGTVVTNTACGPAPVNNYYIDDVGYATTTAAGLTSGNLTGASVNTKNGFSILKYTGNSTGSNAGSEQQLSHNMGKVPAFVIAKNLDKSHNWSVLHHKFEPSGYDYYRNALYLNTTDAAPNTNNVRPWGGVAPTTSIITVSNATTPNSQQSLNYNGDDYILYMWAEIPGLQKFGSYEGNSDDNGPYVELGFRPSILWVKNIDASGNWVVHDNQRNKFNPAGKVLKPDTAGQEDSSTSNYVDFLSNGFKIRNSQSKWNAGYTYIYCAWAEAPTVDLFGGGANAR